MLFNKLLYIAHDKDEQYDGGQDEAYINTRPLRELHALAGIGFLNEALPAPAVAAGGGTPGDPASFIFPSRSGWYRTAGIPGFPGEAGYWRR